MVAPDPRSVTRRPAEFSIDKDGVWHYRGSPIQREALVRLLAGMLVVREGSHFLQTPEQLLRVDVEDAPFIVVDIEHEETPEDGPCIWFLTRHEERVRLDASHPLLMSPGPDGSLRPYVVLREGLRALLHRNVFYRLVEFVSECEGVPFIVSAGQRYPLTYSGN